MSVFPHLVHRDETRLSGLTLLPTEPSYQPLKVGPRCNNAKTFGLILSVSHPQQTMLEKLVFS